MRNNSFLVFCVINKSFGTHFKEGLKLIRTKFQEASLKDVGVIDISARNFIIQHNFKNNCFGEYRWCVFEKCDIKVIIVCPNTCPNIVCGHFSRQTQSRFLVNAPLSDSPTNRKHPTRCTNWKHYCLSCSVTEYYQIRYYQS